VTFLRHRATDPESLDMGVPEAEAIKSLRDLRRVNRWLGGRRSLLAAIHPFLAEGGRILDVGCGSADLPAEVVARGSGRVVAVGVDVKLLHLRQAPATVLRTVADVRALPFAPRSFDVVAASLFLHHFDGPEVAVVLAALFRLARRALIVNDLHRAVVPWLFARSVFPFVFESRVSVEDGLLSIRRAFRPQELRRAFVEARIPRVRIARRFPYRLVAVAEVEAAAGT
jgi:ubiquinone/menaquinone biosynthesis C-methylase UbiE